MSLCLKCLHHPPLRILSTFRQRSPSKLQTRNVNLLHNAVSTATVGLQKLIPWERLPQPFTPHKTRICVRVPDPLSSSPQQSKLKTETQSFEKLMTSDEYLRPGVILCREAPKNLEDSEHTYYELYQLKQTEMNKKRKQAALRLKGKHSKRVQFTTIMDKSLFLFRVQLCWDFVNIRVPVEVHVKTLRKSEWAKVDWTLQHQVHFNPDVMIKAMPEGTYYNIKPRRHGEEYCWVMSAPGCAYGDLDATAEKKRVYLKKLHDRAAKWVDGVPPTAPIPSPFPKRDPRDPVSEPASWDGKDISRPVYLGEPPIRSPFPKRDAKNPAPRRVYNPGTTPEPRYFLSGKHKGPARLSYSSKNPKKGAKEVKLADGSIAKVSYIKSITEINRKKRPYTYNSRKN